MKHYSIGTVSDTTISIVKRKTPLWAILVAIFLFPIGLLALIAKKESTATVVADGTPDGSTRLRFSGEFDHVVLRSLLPPPPTRTGDASSGPLVATMASSAPTSAAERVSIWGQWLEDGRTRYRQAVDGYGKKAEDALLGYQASVAAGDSAAALFFALEIAQREHDAVIRGHKILKQRDGHLAEACATAFSAASDHVTRSQLRGPAKECSRLLSDLASTRAAHDVTEPYRTAAAQIGSLAS